MPNGDKLRPKSTREHLLSIYGYITGIKRYETYARRYSRFGR